MDKLEELMLMAATIGGTGHRTPRTASKGHNHPAHIERRAKRNAKANKAAKASRKRNR